VNTVKRAKFEPVRRKLRGWFDQSENVYQCPESMLERSFPTGGVGSYIDTGSKNFAGAKCSSLSGSESLRSSLAIARKDRPPEELS